MDAEVYMIILGIGIVTFFFLRWIFKRLIKTDNVLRVALTWIGTVILTPIIYLGLIAIFIIMISYERSRSFNKERWFADKFNRYEMRDDLVKSRRLKNKSKQEIVEILGLPSTVIDSLNIWDYELGMSGAGFGWQFNNLKLTFDNGYVTKVEKVEILD